MNIGKATAGKTLKGRIHVIGTEVITAYDIAVKNGFVGTEEEWLESLKGQDGKDGANGKDGVDGKDGADGYTPVKGTDYYTEEEKTELIEEVLDSLNLVSAIDFTNFSSGSFTEVVDGETITHTVTFDDKGNPSSIDGIALKWPAV